MADYKRSVLCIAILLTLYLIPSNNNNYMQYVLFIITLPVFSFISLLVLNSVVLYVYIKYFIPSTSSAASSVSEATAQFKPLRFTHKSVWPKLLQQLEGTLAENPEKLHQLTQDNEINSAINQFLKYILRDFVESWYSKITPPSTLSLDDTSKTNSGIGFPASVEQLIRSAIANIIQRIERTDLLLIILNKVIPKVTFHMYEFRMAETSLRTNNPSSSSTNNISTKQPSATASVQARKPAVTTSTDYIDDLLLASRFRSGQLHKALTSVAVVTTKPTEVAYLKQLIERILPFLFSQHIEEIHCEPVKTVIREILANSVLQPVMSMLADPDFWNQTIDAYLGKAIIEQKMVKQLREVLDRHSTQQQFDDDNEPANDMMNEITKINKKGKRKTASLRSNDSDNDDEKLRKARIMGPRSQLSSNYLGTGISTDFHQLSDSNSDSDYTNLQGSKASLKEGGFEAESTHSGSLFYFFKSAFDPLSLNSASSTASMKKSRSGRSHQQQYEFSGIPLGKQRSFQEFMDMIQEEKRLIDLKRVRNDIVTQIRKRKAQIADRDPEEIIDGERVNDILTYLSRLGAAKKRVDKRIAYLSGEQYSTIKASTSHLFGMGSRKQSFTNGYLTSVRYSLKDILTNTSSLSYFMEFMDRRGEIIKLQFWLIVEGFSNTDLSIRSQQNQFLQDVKMVYDTYFADLAPHRLHTVEQLHSDLQNAIKTAEKSSGNEDAAQVFTNNILELRLRLLKIQQHIFWELEKEHYPYFKRSDLYFKFLSSAPTSMTSMSAIDNVNSGSDNTASTLPISRRSLDETTLYTNQTDTTSIKQRPVSLHEASNSSTLPSSSLKLNTPVITEAISGHEVSIMKEPQATKDSSFPQPQRSQSDNSRLKNRSHQRTSSSECSSSLHTIQNKPTSSRFNYFANMFSSSDYRQPKARSSTSSSLASFLLKPSSTEQQLDNQFYSEPITPIDGKMLNPGEQEPQLQKSLSKRAALVRSNTVDAVEAELRSILDGNSVHNAALSYENDGDRESIASNDGTSVISFTPTSIQRPRARTVSSPSDIVQAVNTKKPPSSSSALNLCGLKASSKTTTALPVQNLTPLPTWTSNGGTSTISEVEHDSLQEIASIKSNKSSVLSATVVTAGNTPPTATINITNDDEQQSSVNGFTESSQSTDNIHFAPPGDLFLTTKIKQLNEEIERLTAQEAIVEALIAKAEEHQNKVEELRILKKSKSMFRQEIQQMEYQKSQYQLQELENVLLPQRTQVHITSATIGSDKNGDFALYIIEVQQLSSSLSMSTSTLDDEDSYASGGWIVARRYSEFFSLHQKLREKFASVKAIDFPSKQWPLFMKLQKSFVEARRISLERYLRALMTDSDICNSQEFRAFLSQQNIYVPGPSNATIEATTEGQQRSAHSSPSLQSINHGKSSKKPSSSPSIQHLQKSILADNNNMHLLQQNSKGFMRQIYKTVAAGIDDIFVAPSMLDLITQRLGEQVVMEFSSGLNDNKQQPLSPTSTHSSSSSLRSNKNVVPSNVLELNASSSSVEHTGAVTKPEGSTHFTEPLCDLFIEMFELKDKNNWLRRQAIVIIIQQILEGTIERKLKETMKHLCSSSMITFYISKVLNSLWPNGEFSAQKEPRTLEQKVITRDEANRKLSTWLPEILGNMVGRQNARKGARRLFAVLQNQRLNQDLVYNLMDEIVYALFPELQLEAAADAQ